MPDIYSDIADLREEFDDEYPAEQVDDLVAFRSDEGILLSDSQKDQVLTAVSVYLGNELKYINQQIEEMKRRRERLIRFMNGLA